MPGTTALDVARWPPWLMERPGSVAPSTAPRGAVTFPTTPLVTRVLIALGADLTKAWQTWPWFDITDAVRGSISTRQGRPDEASTVTTSSASLTLSNRDGRFSRRNPNSPLFGQLTFNTPIWATVDAGSGPKDRIQLFVNEWPVRWNPEGGGLDSTVAIQCAGIMRRLQQGGDPRSALRRTIPGSNPTAYWPLEGNNALASGLAGGVAMLQAGQIQYATQDGQPGSGPLHDYTGGGRLSAPLPAGAVTNQWRLEFVARFGTGSDTISDADFATPVHIVSPSGTVNLWEVLISSGTATLQWSDTAGAYFDLLDSGVVVDDGQWHHFRITALQSASDILVGFALDGGAAGTATLVGKTLNSTSSSVFVNPNQDKAAFVGSVGHLIYWAPFASSIDTAWAARGYAGEMAHARMIRVCGEDGIPLVCAGGVSPAMGPQPVATTLDLCRDAERVDQGVLYEVAWGLGYQTLSERTNEPVSLALDFNKRHIADDPQPADDDQRLRNRWRINRPQGVLEGVAEQRTGTLGTQVGGPGLYDDSATVNVQTDAQLPDQAGWRLHLGIDDEDRWPSIPIHLHNSTDLIDAWTAMPFGGRLTIANPLSQIAPDTIDAIREGWSERWDAVFWDIELATSPFGPYRTGVLAADTGDTNEFLLILTPDTLTLATAVNTTDTSWAVNSSPLWTVAAESFPRLIWWEGEVIRLDVCTGGSAPQTWTVVRSINGVTKSHLANSTGRIYRPGVLALA